MSSTSELSYLDRKQLCSLFLTFFHEGSPFPDNHLGALTILLVNRKIDSQTAKLGAKVRLGPAQPPLSLSSGNPFCPYVESFTLAAPSSRFASPKDHV
jgi:hypothetical protein